MSKTYKDFYAILGIEPTDDLSEIKKAYRKRAKEVHPDLTGSTDDSIMVELNIIKDSLFNEKNLKEYYINYVIRQKLEKEKQAKKEAEKKAEEAAKEFAKKYKESSSNEYKYKTQFEQQAEEAAREFVKNYKGPSSEFEFKYKTQYEQQQAEKKEKAQAKENQSKSKENIKENKKSFMDSMRELREEEKKHSFKKRHGRIERMLKKEDVREDGILKNEFAFQLFRGTVHITEEVLQQIRNLKKINQDTIPKYIVRNRGLIGVVTAFIIITNLPVNAPKDVKVDDTKQDVIESILEDEEVTSYELIKVHNIEAGDTLYDLSLETGVSIAKIKEYNNLTDDKIKAGNKLNIPFEVSKEDLEYCTDSIEAKDMKIDEIAKEYNTDIETLYKINRESIVKSKDTYVIINNNIKVPNFINPTQLNELKQENSTEKTMNLQ